MLENNTSTYHCPDIFGIFNEFMEKQETAYEWILELPYKIILFIQKCWNLLTELKNCEYYQKMIGQWYLLVLYSAMMTTVAQIVSMLSYAFS